MKDKFNYIGPVRRMNVMKINPIPFYLKKAKNVIILFYPASRTSSGFE